MIVSVRYFEQKGFDWRDLPEMLLDLSRENDQLRQTNSRLEEQLQDRMLTISEAGFWKEAALQLNGVFEAAQAACDHTAVGCVA